MYNNDDLHHSSMGGDMNTDGGHKIALTISNSNSSELEQHTQMDCKEFGISNEQS